KNYAGAINEFQKALAITPGDGNILRNLALAKQKLKDVAMAGQTSNALGQLLESAPASAGTLNSALTGAGGANSPALNLVDLDSDPGTVDLRGTRKTHLNPEQAQTLQSLDNVLGNGSDAEVKRQLDDFANNDLAQHPPSSNVQSVPDAIPQSQSSRPDTETVKEIDRAIGQSQNVDTRSPAAAVEGSRAVATSTNSAPQQPRSH